MDEIRHAVERMEPRHYMMASYYERILTGVATLFVEKGIITRDELEARAGGSFPLSRPVSEGVRGLGSVDARRYLRRRAAGRYDETCC